MGDASVIHHVVSAIEQVKRQNEKIGSALTTVKRNENLPNKEIFSSLNASEHELLQQLNVSLAA